MEKDNISTSTEISIDLTQAMDAIIKTLRPENYTDVGQANVFAREYGDVLRFSYKTDWLYYDGMRWRADKLQARELAQVLTSKQLAEAGRIVRAAQDRILFAREQKNKTDEEIAQQDLKEAQCFHTFAIKEQQSSKITATLTEAAPLLSVEIEDLDKDGLLLNTPDGTVNLRTGEMRLHDPLDYCTKITTCSPGNNGSEQFAQFLDDLTCGDKQLQDYLQMVAGMFAIGIVFKECVVIAYGEGGNGKSTFFNLLSLVLGDYAGGLSTDVLTSGHYKNKGPEYAELRGKRMVIAAELEEGARLDTATVKKICSTDKVHAEEKFKQPYDFVPSHTVVMYTNYLPRVDTIDRGTWDRLLVVPFNARFRNQSEEKKNYTKILFENAGEAVLSWIIEGARRFIENGYDVTPPPCVTEATEEYRTDNDWLSQFLEECCITGATYNQPCGELYNEYKRHCERNGFYTRSASDFKKSVEKKGFDWKRENNGRFWKGLQLKAAGQQTSFTRVDGPTPFD